MLGFWRVVRRVSWAVVVLAPIWFVVELAHPGAVPGTAAWQIFVGAPAAVFVAFGAARTASDRERRGEDRLARRARDRR